MKKLRYMAVIAVLSCLIYSCDNASGKKVESTTPQTNIIKPTPEEEDVPSVTIAKHKLAEAIKVGEYFITVTQYTDNAPSPDELVVPEEGKKFVVIEVLYENRTADKQIRYNPFDWKLVDADGYSYEVDFNSVKGPALHDGTLNPGQKARGWITFQPGKAARKFRAQFQPSWLNDGNVEVVL